MRRGHDALRLAIPSCSEGHGGAPAVRPIFVSGLLDPGRKFEPMDSSEDDALHYQELAAIFAPNQGTPPGLPPAADGVQDLSDKIERAASPETVAPVSTGSAPRVLQLVSCGH